MALTPEYVMAHYHLGVVQQRRGDLEAAAREFERAQEEMVGDTSTLHHLAAIRRARGDERGAEELLRALKSAGAKEVAG
jgi:Flp pilus assembly protein TadD